jgi:alkyl sulfatase BDS1-like metallo-beta-lactamase superfamily hydrolase
MGVKLNGPNAGDKHLILHFDFTDSGDQYRIAVENGVLNYKSATQSPDADATISLTRQGLVALALRGRPPAALIENGVISVDGDTGALDEMMSLFDTFEFWFNIVTP